MANIKSKQFASLLTLSTASIDVVSGSFLPDAASTYNVGSSTIPWLSGSFQYMDINQGGQIHSTNLFVSDVSKFTGSIVLKEQDGAEPTAQEGGLMYSGSNFYLGFD